MHCFAGLLLPPEYIVLFIRAVPTLSVFTVALKYMCGDLEKTLHMVKFGFDIIYIISAIYIIYWIL